MASWVLPPDLHHEIGTGPLCPFGEHAIGSRDGLIPRYSDSHACVRCVGALTEGRLSLDVHRIHPRWRRRFLEFWSWADITDPDDCWEWEGPRHGVSNTPIYGMPRHWTKAQQWGAQRVAAWFSWGDIGRLPIQRLCDNGNCVNPLHMRIRGVPHYFNGLRFDVIDLEYKAAKLHEETRLFLDATRRQDPRRFSFLRSVNERWIADRLAERDPFLEEQQGAG